MQGPGGHFQELTLARPIVRNPGAGRGGAGFSWSSLTQKLREGNLRPDKQDKNLRLAPPESSEGQR